MFNAQVDLRFPTIETLTEIIKNAIPQPDGSTRLVGPELRPGDRVTWKSSRYGWTEGTIHEVRARQPRGKYEKVNGEWTRIIPEGFAEQIVVVGEYKKNGRVDRTTIVVHPSSLIKVNKGQSAQ